MRTYVRALEQPHSAPRSSDSYPAIATRRWCGASTRPRRSTSASTRSARARSLNRVPGSSPMPFRWTINPYRGCTHACAYCLWGGTRILMADGRTRPLAHVEVGDAIYGTVRAAGAGDYATSPRRACSPSGRASSSPTASSLAERHRAARQRRSPLPRRDGWRYVSGEGHEGPRGRCWAHQQAGPCGSRRSSGMIERDGRSPDGYGTGRGDAVADCRGRLESASGLRVVAVEPSEPGGAHVRHHDRDRRLHRRRRREPQLLRAPHPQVPRFRPGPRLRARDRRQGQRPRGAARRARAALLEGRARRARDQHRPLPVGRGPLQADGRHLGGAARCGRRSGQSLLGADQVAAAAARSAADAPDRAARRSSAPAFRFPRSTSAPGARASRTRRTPARGWRPSPSSTAPGSPPAS